jgi:hypothetical protein
MRGKKPYNIRNVEAHLHSFRPIIKTNNFVNIIQPNEQQTRNEFINAKFGVSKYTSNLVSGKMFTPFNISNTNFTELK